jgi:hypothetical protein
MPSPRTPTEPAPSPTPAPALAPPGAGIPSPERLIGGLVLNLRARFGSPASFAAQFARERAAIAALYQPLSPTLRARRVLIPRLRGLEDSSRFWSTLMTLDHLRIVNRAIAAAINDLLAGRTPPGTPSTAAVKPSEHATDGVIPEYEAFCDTLVALGRAGTNLRTPLRYPHPWFGPLDAHTWLAMSAMHMGIHRAQIEQIRRALPTTAP